MSRAVERQKGWDGAVQLLVTLKAIPEQDRLDALATFCDAAIKTRWLTNSRGRGGEGVRTDNDG